MIKPIITPINKLIYEHKDRNNSATAVVYFGAGNEFIELTRWATSYLMRPYLTPEQQDATQQDAIDLNLDYLLRIDYNTKLLYRLCNELLSCPAIKEVVFTYDHGYLGVANSFLLAYYVLMGESEREGLFNVVSQQSSAQFDLDNLCLLDIMLGDNQLLIGAVEEFEFSGIAISKTGAIHGNEQKAI